MRIDDIHISEFKLAEFEADPAYKLGKILLNKGIVNPQILTTALRIRKEEVSGGSTQSRTLPQILTEDFELEHDIVYKQVAEMYAFGVFNFEENESGYLKSISEMLSKLNNAAKKQFEAHRVLPVGYDNYLRNRIILAAVDPTKKEISGLAANLNADSYEVLYIPLSLYEKIYDRIDHPENTFLKNLQFENFEYQDLSQEPSIDEGLLEVEINKSALINLFEGALVEGVRKGASDIHFIPVSKKETHICFRIDGRLNLWHIQENTFPEAITAVIKDRSRGLDRFEREKGQDGYIQRDIDGHVIRFRVSIMPVAGTEFRNKFESVVIRILDDRKVITDLEKLGLSGYAKEAFQKSISKPQGMVILTGPTGCGKSTTIIAALNHVMDPSLNVLTVEDPIEYIIKGARQIKLSHKMNFEQAIRSILRHDPDIVLVGEIRDKETADIAIKLANTGHLTFTTLHTNDAPSVVSRLYKMGIEPFLLAYSINVIVAQRLIRKLCSCKIETKADERILKRLKLDPAIWSDHIFYKTNGCAKCGYSGYHGRVAIHETLLFTKNISQIIFDAGENIDEEKIRNEARKEGMLTLRESGIEKVKAGITSFEEIFANTTEE